MSAQTNLEERRNLLSYLILKIQIRDDMSFKRLSEIRRKAGNLLQEKSIKDAGFTLEEIMCFVMPIVREVFEEEISKVELTDGKNEGQNHSRIIKGGKPGPAFQ